MSFCYVFSQDDLKAYDYIIENAKEYLFTGEGKRFHNLKKVVTYHSNETLDGIEIEGRAVVPCIYNGFIDICVADENDSGYSFDCVHKRNGIFYHDYRDLNGRLFPLSGLNDSYFQRIRYVYGNSICYRYWKYDENGWEEVGHFSKYDRSKVKVMGILDEELNWIISPNAGYEYIIPLEVKGTKYYRVGKTVDGMRLWGLLNSKGNEILPVYSKYMSRHINEDTGKVFYSISDYTGNYYGAIDINGNWIIPLSKKFTSASCIQLSYGKYYICKKNGFYGLYDSNFDEVISPDFDDMGGFEGTNYIKFKLNGFWGVMTLQTNTNTTKTIIPTTRRYTSIDRYIKSQKCFTYTMNGYKGECNHLGQQVSKIKVDTPTATPTPATPKKEVTKVEETPKKQEGGGTTTVVVEHHRDPIPVQQWQACWACGGMGTMGCDNCGGSGTKYIGDKLRRCGLCNGQGIRPCNVCFGNKGQYITVYQ